MSIILSTLFRVKNFTIGASIFGLIIVFSIGGSIFIKHDSLKQYFSAAQPPSLAHPLGTDGLGKDVFAQLCLGIQQSLLIGFLVATITTPIGLFIGFIAGYYRGVVDAILRTLTDVFLMLPSLPILILISSLVKKGLDVVLMALIISIFYWAWFARSVRSEILSLKERDFIYIAKLSGMNSIEILFGELMPHLLQWIGARYVHTILSAIMTEVGLEILGLGPQNTVTIGNILFWAINYGAVFRGLWWWWAPPVITLISLFIALFYINLGLSEVALVRKK